MSVSRVQFRFGLVGFGEIGSTVAAGLRNAGLTSIAAYDKFAFDGPFSRLLQERARKSEVTLVHSPQELTDAADVIFSATPGVASVESAAAFALCLTPGHTFVDFASATPKIKQTVAEQISPTGVLVGDGSIEGVPRSWGTAWRCYRAVPQASGSAIS
jgi:3-hydroxyisobutyrate dehydrogenase-like beta-hydroxyacid dehydrogenase